MWYVLYKQRTEFTGGKDNNANRLLEMFCQMLYKLRLLV